MEKHNAALTIDLDAISKNLDILRSYLNVSVKQMAVVKEDAYGHGAVKVAQHIASSVEWFAVNDVYEGIELREHGIETPILVFGVPEKDFAHFYKEYNLTATISSSQHFQLLNEGTEYHLNFDTGMGRLGFRPEQGEKVRETQKMHPELICTGIYSHFATADERDSAKVQRQYDCFKQLRAQFNPDLITHMANTAAAVQLPGAQFNMVRHGIGMYGYAPGEVQIDNLKPAMRWETKIVQIKKVEKTETVSYGARWTAPHDGYMAVIPVGYADGITRRLSGQIEVLIEEEIYPVVGTVTMNYCMVFLDDTEYEIGTKVQLWYPGQTAAHWAQKMSTIPYEMLTNVSSKISRRYKFP